MAELHRLPSQVGMAIGTFALHTNVVHGFSWRYDIVVAVGAEPEYLVMIHSWHCLPILSVMAGIATLTGVNMVDRFASGINTAVDAVASDAFSGGTGELTAGMTTFARDKIVAACQFETSLRVVKDFLLTECVNPATQQHYQPAQSQTRPYNLLHGTSPVGGLISCRRINSKNLF